MKEGMFMDLEREKDIAKAQSDFMKSYRKKEVRHRIIINVATCFIYTSMISILFLCFIRIAKVSNDVMSPTFSPGETIFINQMAYLIRNPNVGEIVIFEYENAMHVGRIVAVGPGEINLKDGEIFWNEKLLEERYLSKTDVTPSYTESTIHLKEHEVFVLGDNRMLLYEENGLVDSRNVSVPIKRAQIKGKVIQ